MCSSDLFAVESRTSRKNAGTNQLCGCVGVLPLQECDDRFDAVDVGLLFFKHGECLIGKILVLLTHKTKHLPKSIATEQAQDHFNSEIRLFAGDSP